ncbi:MAG TPA: MBL fold metallo-hydrolase [Clostridia bacterium]|nr:MBL fold metallo-hydrolase [Clostridia bacterium]
MKIRRFKIGGILMVLLLAMALILTSCALLDELDEILDIIEGEDAPIPEGVMAVHFIDVGQGDSILIRLPSGENMLIDAGDNDKGKVVVDYLKEQGIEKIDHLVGTHPHADHIGGLDDVIDEFDIGDIYMPKVSHTTKTYMDVLEAIDRKGLKIKAAKSGSTIPTEGAKAEILAPDSDLKSDNLNDYSAVIRLTYGQTTFLFQGDAEKKTEDLILSSHTNIKAHVIKLGHHGSSTSNTPDYIETVDPRYAVITLGAGNKYGHPHKEITDLLDAKGITVYRTDQNGTVIAVSDGREVSFK